MEISPMTDTVISSATREVALGLVRPFVMIVERINPTGRKILAAEMAAGNFSRVEADALAQVAAGAHMLYVNAAIPLADEPAIRAKAVQLVQWITDVPLSIDSSIVNALEAGLAVYKGKALVNSVTGEEERLEAVLPLVKKYGAAVVASPASSALTMDESIDSGRSVIDCTSCTARARIAGSSASGMPALTSSMCAPAATCASASASTRLKFPAAISAARILRPVGLMRSPIMTKGRSRPITTSRVAELMTVSVMRPSCWCSPGDRARGTTARGRPTPRSAR